MDEAYRPLKTSRPAAGAYQADPHEARTDLLLGAFGVAKVVCAAALYLAVMFAAASTHPMMSLPFLGVALVVAAALVATDRLANFVAKRRGRAGRSLAALGMQSARIVRRFWFMPLIPLLEHTGFSLWPRLVFTAVAIAIIEGALERLLRSSLFARLFSSAAIANMRGLLDTGRGKGPVAP